MRLALGIALILLAFAAGVVSVDRDPASQEGLVETLVSLLPTVPAPVTLSEVAGAGGSGSEGPAAAAGPSPAPAGPGPGPGPAAMPAVEIVSGGETNEVETTGGDFVQPEVPLYRYEDGTGALRMARGIDAVPPRHRHTARPVNAGNVNHVDVPRPPASALPAELPEFDADRAPVVLFTAPGCTACDRARQHLAALGVHYESADVRGDVAAREHVRRILGHVVVPVLKVQRTYVTGYLAREYDRLLAGG